MIPGRLYNILSRNPFHMHGECIWSECVSLLTSDHPFVLFADMKLPLAIQTLIMFLRRFAYLKVSLEMACSKLQSSPLCCSAAQEFCRFETISCIFDAFLPFFEFIFELFPFVFRVTTFTDCYCQSVQSDAPRVLKLQIIRGDRPTLWDCTFCNCHMEPSFLLSCNLLWILVCNSRFRSVSQCAKTDRAIFAS